MGHFLRHSVLYGKFVQDTADVYQILSQSAQISITSRVTFSSDTVYFNSIVGYEPSDRLAAQPMLSSDQSVG